MTDRLNAFIVILEQDIREDDAKSTIDAIKHIKGVLTVEPHSASPISESIARERLKSEMIERFMEVIRQL